MEGNFMDEIAPALKALDNLLTPAKVKDDFWNYILFEGQSKAKVYARNDDSGYTAVEISEKDEITVLSKTVVYGHPRLIHIPLTIRIGIGDCSFDRTGIYSVSKCSADLFYNDRFELSSVDFFYRRIHDPKVD